MLINDIYSFDHLIFEKPSFLRRFFSYLYLPVLNVLTPHVVTILKRSHASAKKVVENKTSHAALEVLYASGVTGQNESFLKKIIRLFWFDIDNAYAVRNRLKIVRRVILDRLNTLKVDKSQVSLLSIAAGSARAVLESIKESGIDNFRVVFVDKNQAALSYSVELAKELGIYDDSKMSWVQSTVNEFLTSNNNSFDIVEMVGLMDYFNDDKATVIFERIRSSLSERGMFITANIAPNREQKFITHSIGWGMIYRTSDSFKELLLNAGYLDSQLTVGYEPLRIHIVAIADKMN